MGVYLVMKISSVYGAIQAKNKKKSDTAKLLLTTDYENYITL
jgi:hypothetical protein